MKPILYTANEKTFESNGIGRMSDAITCKVTEERNGSYELEMTYPIDGIHYADLVEERILYAPTDDRKKRQPFRIYRISRPINGQVVVYAQHISYDLSKYTVQPFTGTYTDNPQFDLMKSHIVGECPFTFDSTVYNFLAGTLKVQTPVTVRALLGGSEGSFLDTYGGGEYEFDHFHVRLHANRGNENATVIRYGKNLTDITNETDTSDVYTAVVPYYTNGETTVVGNTIYSSHVSDYTRAMIVPLDLSSYFSTDSDTLPTAAQVEEKARAYLNSNTPWQPSQNITVSFIDLASTEEYKDTAQLQHIGLCDIVTVEYQKLGVKSKAKVIKTVYDVLLERYDSIELGDAKSSLADTVKSAVGVDTGKLADAVAGVKDNLRQVYKRIEATEAKIGKVDAETVKTKELEAAVAYLGYVKSKELTTEVANLGFVTSAEIDAKYARLDKANIPTAWIDTAMIGAGVVGTVQIADGSITDAKIVDLTADKITAGTLSVERLIIRGSTSSIVYALNNITGALQAQSVDTINGEILTPRTITADKIVALAITSNEIAANAITTEKLLAGAVTADKISVKDLYTIRATIGGFAIDERSIHIGTPEAIYFVEDFEIMSADDMQKITAGEIDSTFEVGAVYIGQNMIALAYNWFKADGTFNIGKGALSFDGETLSFGGAAQDKVTQICKDTIATTYIVADSVAAENITGTTITGKTFVGGTIKGAEIISDSFLYEKSIDASTYARFKVDSSIMEIGIFEEEGYGGNISFENDSAVLSGKTITLHSSYGTVEITARNGVSVTCEVGELEANCGATFEGPISATSFVNSSSQRYKTKIEDMTDDRALKLLAMRPVSYDYIDTRKGRDQLGLIAEEVDQLESYPVSYDKYNRPDGLDYSRFVPQLIKLCQIQQRQINALQKQIAGMAS